MSGPFLNFIRQGISQASFDLEKANQNVYSQCPEFQNNTERTFTSHQSSIEDTTFSQVPEGIFGISAQWDAY